MKKVLASALFLLGACAVGVYPAPTAPNEDAQQPLVGGTPDSGDPAVVALFAHDPGAGSGTLCTATLVSPRVLLTAAHCVDPRETGDGVVFDAIFSTTVVGGSGTDIHPVAETRFDPDFDPGLLTNGHDIGVAILRDPVTTIAPIPYIRSSIPANVGKTIRLVGYGLNNGFDAQGTSAGTKRTMSATLNSVDPITINVGTFGSTSCNGDSGGPGLVDIGGQETIVGVTSYGIAYCLSAGFYSRVDLYTGFIDKAIADADGGGDSCVSDCDRRECGLDDCGNECPGACDGDQVCNPAGACVDSSAGGGCPAETEGNDSLDGANPLCTGDTIEGTLGSPNDIDYFTFDATANSYYTIILENVSPQYEMAVFKRSATGTVLTVGTAVPTGNLLVFTRRTTTGGAYFVKVSASDPSVDTSNVYQLFLVKQ